MEPHCKILYKYVQKHYPDHQVSIAYEAGCFGYAAHREFESYGWQSLVVNPADIHRKGKEQYTKTDRIDAQLISRELKDGRLESIGIVGEERECFRSLFRRRYSLSKDLRRIKSMIKMQLLYFGVKLPAQFDNDHWSHAFRN
jgi:transposase